MIDIVEKVEISDDEKQKLMDMVDFERLSESTLQRAYEAELVPGSYITKAALSLCMKLRKDLEAAKSTIKSQEQELHKYGLGAKSSSSSFFSRTYEPRPHDSHSAFSRSGESVLQAYEDDDPYDYNHDGSEGTVLPLCLLPRYSYIRYYQGSKSKSHKLVTDINICTLSS